MRAVLASSLEKEEARVADMLGSREMEGGAVVVVGIDEVDGEDWERAI